MNRKLLIAASFVLALLFAIASMGIPEKPHPPRLVNDFYGILTSEQAQALEDKLVAFDNATSIQIAVVIINKPESDISSDAIEIGDTWGVGQADLDNGVVFLWAVDDRDMFIATGSGVEAYLTDIQCGRICREIIGPLFKEERYFEGLQAGTDAIIEALGTNSWEDRQAMQALQEKQDAEHRAYAWKIGKIVGVILLSGIILLVMFLRIRKRLQRGKTVAENISKLKKYYQNILDDEITFNEAWPTWAKDMFNAEYPNYQYSKDSCQGQLDALPTSIWSLGSQQEFPLEKIQRNLEIFDQTDQALTKIREDVKLYQERAPQALKEVRSHLASVRETLSKAENQGLHLTKQKDKLATISTQILGLNITDSDSYRKVFLDAFAFENDLTAIEEFIQRETEARESCKKFPEITLQLTSKAGNSIALYDQNLRALASPNHAFAPSSFEDLPSKRQLLKEEATLVAALEKATMLIGTPGNGMYQKAAHAIKDAEAAQQRMDTIANETGVRLTKLIDLQKSFETIHASVATRVQKALQEVKDSDVETSTQKLAKDASHKLVKAEKEAKALQSNWLIAHALLKEAKDEANKAIKEADEDITRAKRRRSSNASSYGSSYSSSSFGTGFGGGGGGFGGFGGGSFSGGGGGGRY